MLTANFKQSKTTHRQRLEACLFGTTPDRPPVALWRHFPVDDQTPEGLAVATVHFQRNYDFDLVKVTPSSSFCLMDWGVEDQWEGSTEGTRRYTKRVISRPEDWLRLKVLDPRAGWLNGQLTCLRQITRELGVDVPVIQTVFSPLAQAKNLAGGETLLVHLRHYPDAVHTGLRTITASIQRFVEAAHQTGIAGVFYAVQHAQYGLLSEQEYRTFGRKYDLEALQPAEDFWFNMLHLHGSEVMFDLFLDYPVHAINWHDRETSPSLEEAQQRFKSVVCGGLRQLQTMMLGTPQQVRAEVRAAIKATGGKRLILGTGCVTPVVAPHGNLMAVRKSVEEV